MASAEKRLKAVAAEVAKLRPAKLQAKEQMARLDKLTKKKNKKSAQKTRGGAGGSQGGRRKIGDGPRQDSGGAQGAGRERVVG
ncbi:hypothetical protein RI054_11g57950 [Pseudoscourfieldia marina]